MTGFSQPPEPDNTSEPGDEPAIDPVGPNDPEPDVNDGEAPQPMHDDDDDIVSGHSDPVSPDAGPV